MKITINYFLLIVLSCIKFGISQKVAIIGKGAGGGLCSYFLHKIIPGIKIDIYNHQPNKEAMFNSIMFHSYNMYINEIVREKKVPTVKNNIGYNCIIKDGDKFYTSDMKKCFESESFYKGLKDYVTQQFEIFKQIYKIQENGLTFKTVRELLKYLSPDFENYYVNETIESLLFDKNPLISTNPCIMKYIKDELASQYLDQNAHGFVGLALLMFSEIIEIMEQVVQEHAYLLIFIETLFNSDDKIIEMDVIEIIRKNNQNYVVPKTGIPIPYDFVILATTTAADAINFDGFVDPVNVFKYRDLHTIYMTGRLLKKFIKVSKDFLPIIDTQMDRTYLQIPYPLVTYYTIAGLQKLSKSDISKYMKSYKIKSNFTVHVPPDYSIKDDESLRDAKFELAEDLYNVLALHSLSTLHEMVAIGAKNIALLIKNRIEEIGTFADEQTHSVEIGNSSSVIGQRNNQIIDDRSASQKIATSSTVRQRTNQSESGKSIPNRRKSKSRRSKNKFQ